MEEKARDIIGSDDFDEGLFMKQTKQVGTHIWGILLILITLAIVITIGLSHR